MDHEKKLYLQKINLNGHKTINNTAIELQPGINIIIGKNGTGKTNFLEFLYRIIIEKGKNLKYFDSSFQFVRTDQNKKKDIYKFEIKKDNEIIFHQKNNYKSLTKNGNNFKRTISINGKNIYQNHEFLPFTIAGEKPFDYFLTFIKYGIPDKLPIIDTPVDYEFNGKQLGHRLNEEKEPIPNHYSFLKNLDGEISNMVEWEEPKIISTGEQIKNIIKTKIENSNLIENLKNYSPILNIRLCDNIAINLKTDKNSKSMVDIDGKKEIIYFLNGNIKQLYLEYKIGDKWYRFSELSDGIQRLFYIISEFSDIDESEEYDMASDTVFIEEPELGIHPHLLHNLLLFLKEKSDKFQIVITTHSPQILDIIEKNELSKINIATLNKSGNTIFRKLTENQIYKAINYMDQHGIFLSDYWKFSDLEEL